MAEIEVEQEKTRAEIASYLREFADELEPTSEVLGARNGNGKKMTIIVGNESATINPPDLLHFGVDVDTQSSLLEAGMDRRVTLTMRWDEEQVEATEGLEVE